MYFIGK